MSNDADLYDLALLVADFLEIPEDEPDDEDE